jgi:uncharacterized protein
MDAALTTKRDLLIESLLRMESCLVALSGGVDSAVVAKAAVLSLGERAVAFTGQSSSLAEGELEMARQVAAAIGIRHVVEPTHEFAKHEYVRNAADRCYHCKSELYDRMRETARKLQLRVLVNGANADDLGDYRPGMQAASEADVQSPLAACGVTKAEVRAIAQHWGLPVWNKPAAPCLSSRVAYGEEVTPERLAMIDRAERWLKDLGLETLRVRYHRGDLARIEVPLADLPRLLERDTHRQLVEHFKELGFKYITLDLEGFRSGSLNQLIPLEELTRKIDSPIAN